MCVCVYECVCFWLYTTVNTAKAVSMKNPRCPGDSDQCRQGSEQLFEDLILRPCLVEVSKMKPI